MVKNRLFNRLPRTKHQESQIRLGSSLFMPVFEGVNLYVHLPGVTTEESENLWDLLDNWNMTDEMLPEILQIAMEKGYKNEETARIEIAKIESHRVSEMRRIGIITD